ncbi:MAG: hypothetical protein ACKOCV_09535 [Gemmatimonadota bacterium]
MLHRRILRPASRRLAAATTRGPRLRAVVAITGAAIASVVVAATPAAAQLIKVPAPREATRPVTLSATVGFLQSQGRVDGQSGAIWSLGEAVQRRVALDVGLRSGALGVALVDARLPLSRSGGSALANSDGDIAQRSYLVTFRSRETEGAHQIVELGGGLSQWADYRGTDPLTADEAKTRNALTLIVGYGFGFTLRQRATLTLVQDYATLWGPGEGLRAGETRAVRQYVTRVGVRYRFTGTR